jgi:hypothetical protein
MRAKDIEIGKQYSVKNCNSLIKFKPLAIIPANNKIYVNEVNRYIDNTDNRIIVYGEYSYVGSTRYLSLKPTDIIG